ncbi:MAG: sigma-54-dependent Fis family transcriptional regulator [Verrucomicrobia bacterium]|nr:sigma-54-dependent Fis family transcriptional regulator [Verrucomicrobiota bacterium]
MRILIVDDEPGIRKTTRIAIESAGHEGAEAANAARALKAVTDENFDAVFLDLKLGADNGIDTLAKLLKAQPALSVVMFTAYANIATAVEAMRLGAFDFIPKPFTPDQIRAVLAKIEKTRSLESRVRSLENALAAESPPVDLDAVEPAAQRALEVAFKAAASPATMLLLGPSGTGKSVLAREIHARSAQRGAAFVTVSCPSLSRELLESELFGHVKGSFTGAVADTLGKVAAADGGTLFLDEIGELPPEIQPKLLRLLQEREYERVGEPRPRRANVRVIAATNRDLAAEVKTGRFREDLFYRLNVISIALPGLHERPGDLARLAESYRRFFAARIGKKVTAFSPAVLAAFAGYRWPGNLRELRNVIERAVILATGETIEVCDLPEEFGAKPDPLIAVGARVTLDALEAEHLKRILALSRNLDDAAKTLGIDPATLYRKRQKLGLL